MICTIRKRLLHWYDANRRDLPWRRDRDPYRVWLSEVMLQQTRVAAVIPYFERFLAHFPTVEALAAAPPRNVLRLWAGLGYYTRARALHAAARAVVKQRGFPTDFDGWRRLPGVGPYTAAAVSSIVFGRPHAVIDGNVRRVLSRLLATNAEFEQHAASLLDRSRPGDFNQAIMELGATVCLPRAPLCDRCPLASACGARKQERLHEFPAPRKQREREKVSLALAIVERDGCLLVAQPGGDGLWKHFWSLPALPCPGLRRGARLGGFRHSVTYRDIDVQVFQAHVTASSGTSSRIRAGAGANGFRWVARPGLAKLPLSTPSRKALMLAQTRQE